MGEEETLAHDLSTPEGVTALMESSRSANEWDSNCDAVVAANGGKYPDFWFLTILSNGVVARTMVNWY